MNITGCVERIIYRNEDNGYTVMSVSQKNRQYTCVGTIQYIGVGEYISMECEIKNHPIYEEQYVISSYEIKEPEDTAAIMRYLSSGGIKGVGAKLADRIVEKFGEDTFRVIEEEPERLSTVRGISDRMAMDIASQLEAKKDMRRAMMYLQKLGINTSLGVKIYNYYGQKLYEIIDTNPYKLADTIQGVGFRVADEIAKRSGISPDSDFRVKSGILYSLTMAGNNGHSCLPYDAVYEHTKELLQTDIPNYEHCITELLIEKAIVSKEREDGRYIYSKTFYNTEMSIAVLLNELNIYDDVDTSLVMSRVANIEKKSGVALDEIQKKAVVDAVACNLLIITGGPGTGKTTTINTIIKYFDEQGLDIALAAPTGRAAKRMTEATGFEAQTIHRLLGINGNPEENKTGMMFDRNEENPLETDIIIIDEMSMVDMFLMNSLLKAISPGTKLILVGDSDQLPSVGPGNVLKDIIKSEAFNVVKLEKIFRQAEESGIVVNAHKINQGQDVIIDNKSKDFLIVKRDETDRILKALIIVLKEKMPAYVNANVYDIQVLTPMRKGQLGVERLNEILQEYLNPPSEGKHEIETEHGRLREGDKVMQTKNNYQIEWKICGKYGIVADSGSGVFNGDMGIIRNINSFTETVDIEFDDGRMVTYLNENLSEIELAYAITIHKSQGSEYPAVVMPLLSGPKMLMNRNLLYTGITRAKKCVCIIGTQSVVSEMIANESEQKRYSGLKDEIRNICKGE